MKRASALKKLIVVFADLLVQWPIVRSRYSAMQFRDVRHCPKSKTKVPSVVFKEKLGFGLFYFFFLPLLFSVCEICLERQNWYSRDGKCMSRTLSLQEWSPSETFADFCTHLITDRNFINESGSFLHSWKTLAPSVRGHLLYNHFFRNIWPIQKRATLVVASLYSSIAEGSNHCTWWDTGSISENICTESKPSPFSYKIESTKLWCFVITECRSSL